MHDHEGPRIDLNPQNVRGIELFPDVSDEIDRRISHSEQRIKTWVLGGIAANLIVAILAAIPTIFYMGQTSRDISQASQQITILAATLKDHEAKIQENTIWRAQMQARQDDMERYNEAHK